MNVLKRIKKWFFSDIAGRVNYWFTGSAIYNTLEGQKKFVTDAYQMNADVYAITSLIAQKAALIPFTLNRVKSQKMLMKYKALTNDATSASLEKAAQIKALALEEVEDGHPLLALLNTAPNEYMTASEFKYACVLYRLITGNTFVYGFGANSTLGMQDNIKKFIELHVLPSAEVIPKSGNDQFSPVSAYELRFAPGKDVPASDVCHSRYFNPNFEWPGNPHIIGQSPLQAASKVVLRSNSAYTASTTAFQNGGLAGILFEDNNGTGPIMSDEDRKELQKHIDQKVSGAQNFKTILAANTKMGWLKIGESPVDLGIIESLNMDLRTLCNVFHVNSALFNDPENKTYNNMSEARKALITDAVLPEIYALRDVFNKWLVPGYQQKGETLYLDVDTSVFAELAKDTKTLSEWLSGAWWLTVNEKRKQMDYDEVENGDTMLVPTSLTTIDNVISNSETPDDSEAINNLNIAAESAIKALMQNE